MVLLLAGCDRQPLNLREQMTQNLQTLGVRAFYPLRETPRLGSLYLFDQSANPGGAGVAPYMDNEILLTDVLAAPMEAKRRATAAMKTRFVLTKATTDDDKRLGGTTDAPARYVQGDPATNQAQLATAAFPSYTLASVEQFSASAFVPAQFQSFLAALGWRSTRYVHVEAEGVEFAELPLQDMTEVIASACSQKSPPSPLTNEAMGNRLVGRSVELQQALYEERVRMATQDVSQRLSRPKPQIYLMRRIYYMRGIKFGFIPTTLLALVDASIGGKNGIDVGVYKNMVGVTKQPDFILHDLIFLNTLAENQWQQGFAEIIKHACIKDASMFKELQQHDLNYYLKKKKEICLLIQRNAKLKIKVVQNDEFEKGERKLLNFGHTLGHALENQYELSHGEAVAIGMTYASNISKQLVGFKQTDIVVKTLQQYGLPTYASFNKQKVFDVLKMDKKRERKDINFILVEKIGKGIIQSIPLNQLEEIIKAL